MSDHTDKMAAKEQKARGRLEREGYGHDGLVMKCDPDASGYHYVGEIWSRPGRGAVLQMLVIEGPPRRVFSVDVLKGKALR